ncbi:MAG: hypothetical protein KC434_01180 [Anaerolineales bacterium]|nr:hypothetical protein [Anaerolineales bacterium]
MTRPLPVLLSRLYKTILRTFPAEFQADFGEEMVELFGERLAEAEKQGAWAVIRLCSQEVGHWPVALLRLHFYHWQKKRRHVARFLVYVSRKSFFGIPSQANDGRFSFHQLLLEIIPFLFTTLLICLLTYWPPAETYDLTDISLLWAGVGPLLGLLLGLAKSMPRWAYPYGGLLVGYTLWLAIDQRLVWLWVLLVLTAVSLIILAVVVHRQGQPLPKFFQRIGASAALDWTRLSFGLFGTAPLFILAAFDNAFLNQRTAYLALALLVMVVTAGVYGRCQRQDRQLAALLGGTTLLFIPALMDHVYWQSWGGSIVWLLALWAWMITLLLLPLLTVPTQLITLELLTGRRSKE